MASEKYPQDIKNIIPYKSNNPPHLLQSYLTKNYNESVYNEILEKETVHKLSIKVGKAPQNSFYNHIIEVYSKKYN